MGGDLSSVQSAQKELASVCSICGRATEPFELPGRAEKLCLACSADLAATVVLRTEIDTATLAGQNVNDLVAEFAELSQRLLTRAQSADALGSW
jgi:hypothetical protein